MENTIKNEPPSAKKDLIIKEYEQVLITYRENIKVLGQIVTFLVVANVTVCVFAFEHNNYYIFLPGAILMFILYRANHRAAQITLPVVVRGLIIEEELGVRGLMHYTILKINKFEKFALVLKENKLYERVDDPVEKFKNINPILNKFKNITLRYDLPFAISRHLTYVVIFLGFFQLLLFVIAVINKMYPDTFVDLPDLSGVTGDTTDNKK